MFSLGGVSYGHDDSRFYGRFRLKEDRYKGGRELYLPDVMATMAHENRTKHRESAKEVLRFVKGALNDQDLPAHARWETRNDMGIITSVREFGRSEILRTIGRLGYQEAFPEVREAMMHDSDPGLRPDAVMLTVKFLHPPSTVISVISCAWARAGSRRAARIMDMQADLSIIDFWRGG